MNIYQQPTVKVVFVAMKDVLTASLEGEVKDQESWFGAD